jgi:hypothetical protein
MTPCNRIISAVLLVGACAFAAPAPAAAPAFAAKVTSIESAQIAELAPPRGGDHRRRRPPPRCSRLQRCATYVKTAGRLALHEAQLESAADDSSRANLAVLVEDLRARLEVQKTRLPADYAFTPAALAVQEVAAVRRVTQLLTIGILLAIAATAAANVVPRPVKARLDRPERFAVAGREFATAVTIEAAAEATLSDVEIKGGGLDRLALGGARASSRSPPAARCAGS